MNELSPRWPNTTGPWIWGYTSFCPITRLPTTSPDLDYALDTLPTLTTDTESCTFLLWVHVLLSSTCGWQINTAFVERLNLSLRQRVAAIRRRSATACKGEDGLGSQLALFKVYHNFVLPHASLRQAFAAPVATNGSGSAKRWQPRTPAMAAGLTDHVWSLKEVLLYRVPPWPQPQTVKA